MDIEYLKAIQGVNGSVTKKEADIRELRYELARFFERTIDAEEVEIGKEKYTLLITRTEDENIKRIKSHPDETFKLGAIVSWCGVDWIVHKKDMDMRLQTKGRMKLCNCCLRWRLKDGAVVEYPGFAEDATKYSEGIQGGAQLKIGEFQVKVVVTLDEYTAKLRRDMRFLIDAGQYIGSFGAGDMRPSAFRISRRNVITGTVHDEGYVEITLIEDQFVEGKDDPALMLAAQPDSLKEIYPNTEGVSAEEEGWL